MNCPKCDGKGFELITGFMHYSNRKGEYVQNKQMTCYQCKGTGQISDAQAKQMEVGQIIKEWRIKAGLSQRKGAEIFNLKVSEYNDLEHGRFGF